jgi:uncharacterized delta-60 repeat protein
VSSIAIQPDGKILIGGSFDHVGDTYGGPIARLHPDGTVDTSFRAPALGGIFPRVSAVAIQPDGKVLLGGGFEYVEGAGQRSLIRVNSDGSLDPTFEAEENWSAFSSISSIVLQANGDLLIARLASAAFVV